MAGFDIGSVVAKIKADTSDFKRGMASARKETSSFASGLKNAGKLAVKGGLIIGAAAATAAAAVGVAALKQAAAFEQAQIAFSTMLGSAEAATKLLGELADFAKKTPFELQGIEASAKMLLAMGAEADEVIPELKMLGDVSAGLNVPLDRLALNFGQVRTQGKLTGRELRDFNVAGVPLIDTLAKLKGVSKEAIAELVSKGKIGFDDVKLAFEAMTGEGGKFGNLMEAQSKTLPGMIENLKDEFNLLMREIGKELLPAAKMLVTFALEKLIPALRELSSWFVNEGIPKLKELVEGFKSAQGGIQSVIDRLIGVFLKYKDRFQYIFDGIVSFVGWVVDKLTEFWNTWGAAITATAKSVLSVLWSIIKNGFDIILGIITLVIAIFKGDWGKAWEAVKQIFTGGVELVKTIFDSLKTIVEEAMKALFETITGWFKKAWEGIKEDAKNIKDSVKDAFNVDKHDSPSIRDTLKEMVSAAELELGRLSVPDFRTDVRGSLAVAPAVAAPGGSTIIVNLDGAIIADSIGAQRMGEMIGDNIIRKLKKNVRF